MEQDILQKKMNGICLKCALKNQNKNSQEYSNDAPPAWFKSYMETMKKDIVEEVSNNVAKSILQILNKQVSESNPAFHSDLNDEQNFEMIHMPLNYKNVRNCNNYSKRGHERRQEASVTPNNTNDRNLSFEEEINGSNRDSPSFELLSETPSPPVSIYIDEDHFSTNENYSISTNTNSSAIELNVEKNVLFVVDANGKIYKHFSDKPEKLNIEIQQQSDDDCSFSTTPVNVENTNITQSEISFKRRDNRIRTDVIDSSHIFHFCVTTDID